MPSFGGTDFQLHRLLLFIRGYWLVIDLSTSRRRRIVNYDLLDDRTPATWSSPAATYAANQAPTSVKRPFAAAFERIQDRQRHRFAGI